MQRAHLITCPYTNAVHQRDDTNDVQHVTIPRLDSDATLSSSCLFLSAASLSVHTIAALRERILEQQAQCCHSPCSIQATHLISALPVSVKAGICKSLRRLWLFCEPGVKENYGSTSVMTGSWLGFA